MTIRTLVIASGLALAATLGPDASPAPAADLPEDVFAASPDDNRLDLLILADDHPVVVRCRIEVGGLAFRKARGDFLALLHAYLDADRDGILTPEEVTRGSWSMLFADRPFDRLQRSGTARTGSAEGTVPDEDGDGRVSIAELDRYILRSFGIQTIVVRGGPPPDPRTEQAFAHLDLDGDGRIDPSEMAVAAESLRVLDRNEDEWIVLDEMNPYSSNTRRFFGIPNTSGTAPPRHPFEPLLPGDDRTPIARKLLNRYDRNDDGRLDPEELGLSAEAVPTPLDLDGLTRWLDDPSPHLELSATIPPVPRLNNTRRITRALELSAAPDAAPVKIGPAAGQTREVDLGPLVAEFQVNTAGNDFRQFLLDSFDNLLEDGKDSVDRERASQNGVLGQTFDAADRNGDGALTRKELVSYLDMFDLAASSRLTLAIADRGRSVFQAIDADSDSRLSARELVGLPDRLLELDRDGDGSLTLDDFPNRFAVVFGLGSNAGGGVTVNEAAPPPRASRAAQANDAKDGPPPWFFKMDRNGDGDVSFREFLGPLDVFRRLDADGDGLISPEEASRDAR